MAWVRLDDQVPHNRKILRAGPAACWLWICGLAHSQRQKSNGFVAVEVLPMIGVHGVTRCEKLAETLVTVGLFDRVDGGYQIHDYLHFNESAAESVDRAQQLYQARAKAGRSGGLRSAEARRLQAESSKQANGKQASSNCTKQNEAPTRPDPTRPEKEQIQRVHVSVGVSEKPDDETGTRAARFLDRYAELYPVHRGGARFLPKPALDYQAACELVKVWDDARLEKLAIIFLKTDHEFAASGSRTIRQFAAMASWADGRLAEVEAARRA